MNGVIYKITNKENGKIYVGQTVRKLKNRWTAHIWHAIKRNSPLLLHQAIRKYGPSSFNIEVILECSNKVELDEREKFYIKELSSRTPSGYNLTAGGDGASPGHPVSAETREKIGASHRGIKDGPLSYEHKKKLSLALSGEKNPIFGRKVSAETRLKLRLSHLGIPNPHKGVRGCKSIEALERISEAAKARHLRNFLKTVAWG